MGVPIRTSVGGCRFWKSRLYGPLQFAASVAPYGAFRVTEDEDEYRVLYYARLNAHRDEALAELDLIAGGGTGALMCFCDLAKSWCHRRQLAEWIKRETGLIVPEVSDA